MSRAEAAHPDRAAADPGQPVPHLSPEERAALGKAARERTPRATQAHFARPDGQPDAVDLLESQAASRVPDLVPIRYGRMMTSPFAFYRGAALVMASDLAGTPNSGLRVQLCGDAHMSNFGVFASPERRLVFDINDFDETLPGPWEWDVKRLAASLEIAARQNGFAEKARKDILLSTLRGYREPMRRFAAMRTLDVWYSTADMAELQVQMADQLDQSRTKRLSKELAKARTKDSLQAFEKLTHLVGGERRIAADPPLIVPIADLAPGLEQDRLREEVHRLVQKYRETLQSDRRVLLEEFRYVDLARKVVGVGSVGTRAWIALLLGRDEEDPLFLQVKEAQTSVLAAYAGDSEFANQGERVVAGQRLMQASSDIFLGWLRTKGLDGQQRDFYFRQLRDWKGSVVPEEMVAKGMALYGRLCGWALARAHACSGDRIAIASYLGGGEAFDRAVAEFAVAYADQNERDYAAFAKAVESGRLTAQTGL